MKSSHTKTKTTAKKSTKTTAASTAPEEVRAEVMTADDREMADYYAKKAVEDAKRAGIAKQIGDLVAQYDEGNAVFVVGEVPGFLASVEANMIQAIGLVGAVKHDECGGDADDLEKVMRQLTDARCALQAARMHLERAGVLVPADTKAVHQ